MRTTALALLCLAAAAAADDAPRDLVRKILATRDPAERSRLVDALVAASPDPREVAKWFEEGRAYSPDVPKGWLERKVKGSDGKERPYMLYVPENYVPGNRYPFLFDLHGGVSRDELPTHAQLAEAGFWGEAAKQTASFLAVPSGEKGAEWWTSVGAGNILSILDEARRTYDIDENRVVSTGFSDGASGSFYLALACPDVFAGVVPLNGHPSVAQAGGLEVHLRNLMNVPMYAINTDADQLYPSAGVKPIFDALKTLGAPVTWREITGFGHDASYLQQEGRAVWGWIANARRNPQPNLVVWEGNAVARVRWLKVTKLGAAKNAADFPDINPKLPPGRARIGVTIDPEYQGVGVLVKEVQKGMPAEALGLRPGDVITGFDGNEIKTMSDLQAALQPKKAGDTFKIRFRHDEQMIASEETIEKEGKFGEPRSEDAFRRGGPYASIEARAKDNVVEVRSKVVSSFEILLATPLFDLAKPVTVKANGETVFEGVVAPDLKFLVQQAAEDGDRAMVYVARIAVSLPPR